MFQMTKEDAMDTLKNYSMLMSRVMKSPPLCGAWLL